MEIKITGTPQEIKELLQATANSKEQPMIPLEEQVKKWE